MLAPCTHQKACPLLEESNRPWCHFHFRWQPGDIVKQIAVPLGLTAGKGSMSYLAMQPAKEGGLLGNRNPELARVIGDPMDVRHTDAGIYLCQDGKRRVFRNPPKETTRGALLKRGRQNRDARLVAPWPGGSPDSWPAVERHCFAQWPSNNRGRSVELTGGRSMGEKMEAILQPL